MTLEALFWPVVLLALVGVTLFFVLQDVARSTRAELDRSFRCPIRDLEVTATFRTDFFDRDRFEDVLACTAFDDPLRLECDRGCLRLTKAELARQDRERSRPPFGIPHPAP